MNREAQGMDKVANKDGSSNTGENRANRTRMKNQSEQSGTKGGECGKQKEGSNAGENRTSTGDGLEAADQILNDNCDL